MKNTHLAAVEESEELNDEVIGQEEYPPETERHMSWAAIKFIKAPTFLMFDLAVGLICFAFALCILLSFYIEFDVGVKGFSEITAERGVREAISLSDGTVTELLKKLGDDVEENEVIARITGHADPLSEIHRASGALNTLKIRANEARESNELMNNSFEFPDVQLSDPILLQNLASTQQALRTFKEQQRRILAQFDASNELHFTRKRIQVLTGKLEKMKSSPQRSLLQLHIESTEEELGRLKSQVLSTQNQAKLRLDEALSELLRAVQVAKGSFDNYMRRHEVRSPIAGRIAKVFFGLNTFVVSGKPIATVIPKSSRFETHIEVASKDIAKVRLDQRVYYKVEAYPYQRFGLFSGVITSIDQVAGDQGRSPDSFIVKATIESPVGLPDHLERQIHYVVGMRAEAKIITERKSIKDLFVETFFFKIGW